MLAHICGPSEFLLSPALSSSKSCSFSSNQLATSVMPTTVHAAPPNSLAAHASASSHVSLPSLTQPTHIHSIVVPETSATGPSQIWPVDLGPASVEVSLGTLSGSPFPCNASDAAAPLDAAGIGLSLQLAGGALLSVLAVAGLLSEGARLLAGLLPAAAAAAAAARAAAAVLAALALRYCTAADMALATRGGVLCDSRASFSLTSLLSADSPSSPNPAAPCRSLLCMFAAAAAADGSDGSSEPPGLLLRLPLDACAVGAVPDATTDFRLYSRALAMRAAASLLFGAPVLFAFIRCWKACMLRSASDERQVSPKNVHISHLSAHLHGGSGS